MGLTVKVLVLLFVFAVSASAQSVTAQRYVCAAGDATCGGTPAYSTIAAALTAAVSGDIICLKKTETFTQSVVTLPDKGNLATPITIRSCAADSLLPADGIRITPAYNAQLPIWRSSIDNTPALQAAASAQDYIIKFIRFKTDPDATGHIIRIGVADTTQQLVSQQPDNITIDRVIIEGDIVRGGEKGVTLNGKSLTFKNSYCYQMDTRGVDGQCVFSAQGQGPFTISNNYLSGATETVLFGGQDPQLQTNAAVKASPVPTTTVFTLETFRAGHDITSSAMTAGTSTTGTLVAVSLATGQEHVRVTNISGNQITVSPALSVAPIAANCASGIACDVRWGIVPHDVTITRNYFTRPADYRLPILDAPTNVALAFSNTAGTLAAGTHCYRVTAFAVGYDDLNTHSAATTEKCLTTTEIGQITITWTIVDTNATAHRVWGRSSNAQTMYFAVNAPTATYTDTGSAGTAATLTSTIAAGSKVTVKAAIEIKACVNCTLSKNIFEYGHEFDDQDGHLINIKSVSQSNSAEFSETANILVENNWLRHASACFKFSSSEPGNGSSTLGRPNRISGVIVRNNLCTDIGTSQWGTAVGSVSISRYTLAMEDLTMEHNTFGSAGSFAIELGTGALVGTNNIRSNIWPSTTNGVKMAGLTKGDISLAAAAIDLFTYNWIPSAPLTCSPQPCVSYPATTINANTATLQAEYVAYGGVNIGDWALASGSIYRTAGHDGAQVGANITTLSNAIAGVVEGVPESAPVFTTSTLPSGTIGQAYTATIVATGGTGARTLTVKAGSTLPTGLTLSTAGVLSGTPSGSPGTSTFTITATDTLAVATDREFSLVIAASSLGTVTITTVALDNGSTTAAYSATLSATGGVAAYGWSFVDTSKVPLGWSIGPSTGIIAGLASLPGTFTFSVKVSSGALTDTQEYTVAITSGGGGPITGSQDPAPRPKVWQGQEIWTFASSDQPDTSNSRVRAKDIWVDDNGVPWTVTATSPAMVFSGIGAHLMMTFLPVGSTVVLADTPDNGMELPANMRYQVDLSRGYSLCRLMGFVDDATAVSGSVLTAQYYNGSSWQSLTDSDGSFVTTATGHKIGTFGTLASAARTDVLVRLYHSDGDAADDVTLSGVIALECK